MAEPVGPATTTTTTATTAAAEGEREEEEVGEPKDPRYPLEVVYCPSCGMPPEYCEFGPDFAKCKREHPELHPVEPIPAATTPGQPATASTTTTTAAAAAPAAAPEARKGPTKKKVSMAPSVVLSVASRGKRKHVTTVTGLDGFGVKLADASKLFSKTFSCGASVVDTPTGAQAIDVQGDVAQELLALLQSKFSVPKDSITIQEEKKKKKQP